MKFDYLWADHDLTFFDGGISIFDDFSVQPLRSSGIDQVGPDNTANDWSKQGVEVFERIRDGFESFESRFTC